MKNALFAFEDPAAARDSAARLVEAGLPATAVISHLHDPSWQAAGALDTDELVTGGLVRNAADLLQGLFEWGGSPHDASPFEETVRRGGAVLEVRTRSDDERAQVERVLQDAKCARRSDWRDA